MDIIYGLVILALVVVVVFLLIRGASPDTSTLGTALFGGTTITPAESGKGIPFYTTPYATNGKDGCVKQGTDGKCQVTACQIDVNRACVMAMNSMYTDPTERSKKTLECRLDIAGSQCNLNMGSRTFDCNIDQSICNYDMKLYPQ